MTGLIAERCSCGAYHALDKGDAVVVSKQYSATLVNVDLGACQGVVRNAQGDYRRVDLKAIVRL